MIEFIIGFIQGGIIAMLMADIIVRNTKFYCYCDRIRRTICCVR